jgi:hypothetical protein
MKLRTRHLSVLFLGTVLTILATVAWLVTGPFGAVLLVGLGGAAWAIEVWVIRRKPEYHERKFLYLCLEQWIYSHACGQVFEVDGLLVQCCSHLIGPHVRLWPQHPEDHHVRVDDYMLKDMVPGIRHGMMLGTVNGRGELETPQPTSLRAIIHKARFEQDSGVIETTVNELRELLDRLDRARPVRTLP